MITIGILGANGQVGTETCLYLSKMKNVQVIPICRSEFASAFLSLSGVECRIGNISNINDAPLLLKDCDLIADFTYLNGLPSEIKIKSRTIIQNVMKYAGPNTKFVFASSMMAYGMGKNNIEFKSYFFARSVYGGMKRYSEKLALNLGNVNNKEVYVLRLGQVHGELQSVSRKIIQELKDTTAYIPNADSYTIFPFTIAEALVNIASGLEKPGLYTLISNPEWRWKEIHEYYCNEISINPKLCLYQIKNKSIFTNLLIHLKNLLLKLASNYAEPIASYILVYFPKIEKRFMAKYYIQKAKAQINEFKETEKYIPYSDIHHGKILGKRLITLSDSRTSMKELNHEVKTMIEALSKHITN